MNMQLSISENTIFVSVPQAWFLYQWRKPHNLMPLDMFAAKYSYNSSEE